MYKKIILENQINGQILEIPLKAGVNLIVGPRGGGKSSLLELLAGTNLNIESKKVKSVFKGTKEMPFAFKKIINDSGEQVDATFLNSVSNKVAKDKYDQKDNIIAQNDTTKVNLIDTSQIEKSRKNAALEIVSNDDYLKTFNKFNDLKTIFAKISSTYSSKRIYWKNVFNIGDSYAKKNIFITLNYDNSYARQAISGWIKNLEKFKKELNDLTFSLRNFNNFLKMYNPFLKNLKIIYEEEFNKIKKSVEKIKKAIASEIKKIKKYEMLSTIFYKKYNQIIDELKKSTEEDNKAKAFQVQSLDHMKEMAKLFKEMKAKFSDIFRNELSIKNSYSQTKDLLEYKLEGIVLFSDEEKTNLLESLLYKSNTTEQVVKWLDQYLNKGYKETRDDTFKRALAKIIETKVEVYANNKIYEHMSPGEKSIFGIKYKLTKSRDQILFLDQPEDNLDNNTIAKEMLDLINNHPAKQIILVTHNANIGILTNPTNVIIANIDDKSRPYFVGKIPDLKDDPKAFYLEGGSEYLIKRYKKLINNKESEM